MSRRSLITGFLLFTAAAVGFAIGRAQEPAGQLPAPGSPQLKTLDEQAAYAIGLDVGRDVMTNAPEVDPTLVARGLIDAMRKAKPLLKQDGLLWVTYPKAGQRDTDLKREVVWDCGQTVGLRCVSQIAVDEVWSALRMKAD